METLIIIGAVLAIIGIIGSILPVMPGPIFSFIALVLLYVSGGSSAISLATLITFGITMVIITIIDYAAPIIGAKYFGASRYGIWGAIGGAIIGIFLFPPLGIFLGALAGATIGERVGGKDFNQSARAGLGVLMGSISVIVIETIFSIIAAVYFFSKAF